MKSVNIGLAIAVALMMFTGAAEAVKFDRLFRVTSVTGDCQVKAEGKDTWEAAQSGKAYLYGSYVKTGRKSSLIVVLADGNECQVLANAQLQMTEDPKNPKLKIIKLDAGRVDVDLDPDFEESGYGLEVETAAAICAAVGCKFSNDVRSDKDMSVSTFGVSDGTVKVNGRHFSIPLMDTEDFISVATSLDKEFTRIKNLKGSYQIQCKNSAGDPQTLDIALNAIVKIWARRTEIGNNVTVTTIFTSPDGKVEQAFTYTEQDPRSPAQVNTDEQETQERIRQSLKKIDDNQTVVTTTTTTTTTVTTSSTIPDLYTVAPNVTPSGRR